MKTPCTLLLVGLAVSLALPGWAYFSPDARGVRPAGMGEAFVAVADDANSILFNPAGLARLDMVELVGMYSDLYSNLNARLYTGQYDPSGYNFISLAVPLPPARGVFGLGWTHLYSTFYKENAFMLSYGSKLWEQEVLGLKLGLSAGINVKGLQWMVEANDFTTDENFFPYAQRSQTGFTADVGVLLDILPELSAGFSADNVVPVDMGLTTQEVIPMVFRLGAAYRLPVKAAYADDVCLALGADARDDFSGDIYNFKFGTEAWFLGHRLALRAGVTRWQASTGLSVRYAWPQSPLILQVDYAFMYPFYILDTAGSHLAGLSVRWDLRDRELEARLAREANEKKLALQEAGEIKQILAQAAGASQQALQQARAAVPVVASGDLTAKKKVQEALQQCLEAMKSSEIAALRAQALGQRYPEPVFQELSMQSGQSVQNVKADKDQINELVYRVEDAYINQVVKRVVGREQDEAKQSVLLPELDAQSITVGVERRIYADYGSYENVRAKLERLVNYLRKQADMKLSWVEYQNPAELLDALQEGKLDLFATYDEAYKTLYAHQAIRPVITVQKHGKVTQTCCLMVRKDNPVTRAGQLQGQVIGCARQKLFDRVLPYFKAEEQPALRPDFYRSCVTQSDVTSALWALQTQDVQALLEFEYILDICSNMQREMPIGVKVIARSAPIVNAPLIIRDSRNPDKKRKIQKVIDALLQAHTQAEMQDFFEFFQIDRFVPFDQDKYGREME